MLSQFDKYRSVTGERKYYINIYIHLYMVYTSLFTSRWYINIARQHCCADAR